MRKAVNRLIPYSTRNVPVDDASPADLTDEAERGRSSFFAPLMPTGEKWPDVFVAQPSGEFAGLFLEFKAKSPFKKDGVTLLANEHAEAQARTMERLRVKGYKCEFVWGFQQAQEIVNKYFSI